MSLQKFCNNFNKEDLLMLPESTKNLLLQVSEILVNTYNSEKISKNRVNSINKLRGQPLTDIKNLKAFYGLAYIIKNMLKSPIPKIWDNIYGVTNCILVNNTKYNIKVLFLNDTHNLDVCSQTEIRNRRAVSANDFIIEQLNTAECFMDLFLEIPYRYRGASYLYNITGTYMRNLKDNLETCFNIDKLYCNYPNLRAHYIDTRIGDTLGQDLFFFLHNFIPKSWYNEGYGTNSNFPNFQNVSYWEKKENLKNIFRNKDTLTITLENMIYTPSTYSGKKLKKQLDNIKDIYIREQIIKALKEWIYNPTDRNVNWKYMTWDYMINAMKTKNKSQIEDIYYSLFSYFGLIMDIYTLGRMFRDYRPVPNFYSGPAKNMIVYAGGQHNDRFLNFMVNYLKDTKIIFSNELRINCPSIRELKQPVFVS